MSSRERILARVRAALTDVQAGEPDPVERRYRCAHAPDDPAALLDLFHDNLAEYRAGVHRTTPAELPATVARLLAAHGSRRTVVPQDLDPAWVDRAGSEVLTDGPALTAAHLDTVDSVVTACALAIAETGTIVLETGPGQGRRALTLVPDHHICVVLGDQIVASVPHALPRLDPLRPQTWISGPSATSDIELSRVEGVHGPRILDVVLCIPKHLVRRP